MTFGIKIGRALGATAALAGHGIVVAATSSGKFASDVVTGAEQGYTERAAHWKQVRAAAEARLRVLEAEHDAAMDAVSKAANPPAKAAKARRSGAITVTG